MKIVHGVYQYIFFQKFIRNYFFSKLNLILKCFSNMCWVEYIYQYGSLNLYIMKMNQYRSNYFRPNPIHPFDGSNIDTNLVQLSSFNYQSHHDTSYIRTSREICLGRSRHRFIPFDLLDKNRRHGTFLLVKRNMKL